MYLDSKIEKLRKSGVDRFDFRREVRTYIRDRICSSSIHLTSTLDTWIWILLGYFRWYSMADGEGSRVIAPETRKREASSARDAINVAGDCSRRDSLVTMFNSRVAQQAPYIYK